MPTPRYSVSPLFKNWLSLSLKEKIRNPKDYLAWILLTFEGELGFSI